MATNWALNWAVVFCVPYLMENSQGFVFFCFGGVCVISGVIVDLWLPETAGQNLDASFAQHEGMLRKVFGRCCRRCKPQHQPPLLATVGDIESNDSGATTPKSLKLSNKVVKF